MISPRRSTAIPPRGYENSGKWLPCVDNGLATRKAWAMKKLLLVVVVIAAVAGVGILISKKSGQDELEA